MEKVYINHVTWYMLQDQRTSCEYLTKTNVIKTNVICMWSVTVCFISRRSNHVRKSCYVIFGLKILVLLTNKTRDAVFERFWRVIFYKILLKSCKDLKRQQGDMKKLEKWRQITRSQVVLFQSNTLEQRRRQDPSLCIIFSLISIH